MSKYSETLTEHVMAPRNGGAIDNADLTGHAGAPGRGAFMIIYLKVQGDRIAAARYHTVGCGPTIASGSMLTEMIVGRSIAECGEMTVTNLIERWTECRRRTCIARPCHRGPARRAVEMARPTDGNGHFDAQGSVVAG